MSDSIAHIALAASEPFTTDGAAASTACGVVATHVKGPGIASVMMRRGTFQSFKERLSLEFGAAVELQAQCVHGRRLKLIPVAPGAWMAVGESNIVAHLQERLSDLASVADQSSGYVILRLSGPSVRDALAKLIPVDLHPQAFHVNDAASTVAAHIGLTLWRCEDLVEGHAVFELACFRSFSACLVRSLRESAAEFGFSLQRASG